MITIVDYRAGNLASVRKAFEHLGHPTEVTAEAAAVARAGRIVLPGVGHFGATVALEAAGLRAAIVEAIARGVPFLGICVGMQWLFAGSEEAPEVPGLGVFPGRCARFNNGLKVPHVGWNTVERRGESRLLRGLPGSFFCYYTHSFHAPGCEATAGVTEYGAGFCAVVERGNVFGVQFHPEKSAEAGLRVLDNFARLAC